MSVEAEHQSADVDTHHIEGYARHHHAAFSMPLITQIEPNFWQGGCRDRVSLGAHFKHVISLYPWERYKTEKPLDSFTEVRLFDSHDMPDREQIIALAIWVNVCRRLGPTLVHCQAGLNRSGLIAGTALILSGMDPKAAIEKLRASRSPAVLCNSSYERFLLEFHAPPVEDAITKAIDDEIVRRVYEDVR